MHSQSSCFIFLAAVAVNLELVLLFVSRVAHAIAFVPIIGRKTYLGKSRLIRLEGAPAVLPPRQPVIFPEAAEQFRVSEDNCQGQDRGREILCLLRATSNGIDLLFTTGDLRPY